MDSGRKYKSRGQPPCDACRKRRICCVRLPGALDCALCQTRQVHCTYNSVPVPKHGRGPSRRQRAATAASSESTTSSSQKEPSKTSTAIISSSTTGMSPKTNSATLAEPTRWITQFLGLSGDQDPFVLRHCAFDADCYKRLDWACLRVSGSISNSGDFGGASFAPAQFAVVPDTHLDARPTYYPSAETWHRMMSGVERQRLLAVYASTIHTSFPLLDQQQIASSLEGPLPSSTTNNPDSRSLLLVSMCALSAHLARGACSLQHRRALYQYVFEALPIERRHPRLEVVEAALVFLQRYASINRAPTTPGLWSEIGAVVGMCHELGLNVDPTGWHITVAHRNRRIRLWWATYILATFCSLGLGRPSYISDDDWSVPMLGPEHFSSSSSGDFSNGSSNGSNLSGSPSGIFFGRGSGSGSPTGMSPGMTNDARAEDEQGQTNFIIMAHLAVLLARLLSSFYSLAAVERLRHAAPVDIHLLFLTFQQQLLQLKALHLDRRPSMAGAFLDSSGFVRLAYHAVEIALCRAALRNLDASFPYYTSVRLYAQEAVESVVTLLRTLQINQLRAYWWNPLSQIHFSLAGSFLFYFLLSSTTEEEIDYWTAKIKEYRQLLELDNYGFPVTRLAATRMALLASVNNGDGGDNSLQTPVEPSHHHASSFASNGEYFDGYLNVEKGN
ncbi:hypothetical protein SBRCBS47491_008248 [Sporothrix bragantina]|uniref:Zn(2)-C6 fungal-type domain-containing protein n=1 Tax=Sporothrix bragantina TaxID=671064 RepID=A0ABP0CJZ8_9PEZI